jgi:inhibitor of KinA
VRIIAAAVLSSTQMAIKPIDIDVFPASDSTLLVRFDSVPEANEEVLALARQLHHEKQSRRILNLHPAYESLLIRFNPLVESHAEIEALVRKQLQARLPDLPERKQLDVPVCYGGVFGPDLEEVARLTQLTPAEVIEIHSSVNYKVYFLGFAPGFPYLGGMDRRLVVPRLDSPRKEVARGSVGIAGEQTGIYPVSSPGGWRLIGRTPLRLFRPDEPNPSLILPGDWLRFRPISPDEYERAL